MSNTIRINNQNMTYHILRYNEPPNMALRITDEMGMPEATISTNPEYPLPKDCIAIRNDNIQFVQPHVDALVKAGIIEVYFFKDAKEVLQLLEVDVRGGLDFEGQVQVPIGFVWGTLYKVLVK